MLQLCICVGSSLNSCCDNAVLMLWLGLGTETTWLGFGEDHVFCCKVPVSVNTHMAEDVQRATWKYWLASHKYWHTVTPSPPRSPPDVTVWSNMKMLMLMWEWQVMNECQNGTWPMTQCESVVCRIVDCQHRLKWCHLRTSVRLHASPSGATNTTFLHVALPKTDKQTLMCKVSAWYSFLLRGVFRVLRGNSDKPLSDQQNERLRWKWKSY